jgi:hypothetical protein
MQRIEHHHPRNERHTIVNNLARFPVAPKYLQHRFCSCDVSHG